MGPTTRCSSSILYQQGPSRTYAKQFSSLSEPHQLAATCNSSLQAERDMLSLLANRGGCDRACQLRVRHAVSLHANGKARQHAVLDSRARLAAFLHSAARAAKRVAPRDLLA